MNVEDLCIIFWGITFLCVMIAMVFSRRESR